MKKGGIVQKSNAYEPGSAGERSEVFPGPDVLYLMLTVCLCSNGIELGSGYAEVAESLQKKGLYTP